MFTWLELKIYQFNRKVLFTAIYSCTAKNIKQFKFFDSVGNSISYIELFNKYFIYSLKKLGEIDILANFIFGKNISNFVCFENKTT